MTIVFGLLAAAFYGAADFVGGVTSRKADEFSVVLLSQSLAAPMIAASLLFTGGEATGSAFLWGGIAGLGGGAGVLLLYRGLANGRMSVVAPVTSVLAAALPVAAGAFAGERPSALTLFGVALALAAIGLVSRTPETEASPERSGLVEAMGAGACFGAFFICLDTAGDDTGMWPLLAARITALALVGALAFAGRRRIATRPEVLRGSALAGVLDVGANVTYILSARAGLLAVAAVLTSMYPAGTVLLARTVLKERLHRPQVLGLGVGLAGVTLMTLG